MRRPMIFRFNNQAVMTLSALAKELHVSKTILLEQALQAYAKKTLFKKNTLMEYAGILHYEDAEKMGSAITSSRHNKIIKAGL